MDLPSLPGVAAFRTIEANHKLALSRSARSLALEGNPVHEDMMDALPEMPVAHSLEEVKAFVRAVKPEGYFLEGAA